MVPSNFGTLVLLSQGGLGGADLVVGAYLPVVGVEAVRGHLPPIFVRGQLLAIGVPPIIGQPNSFRFRLGKVLRAPNSPNTRDE